MGRGVDVLFVNHGATGRVIGPNGDIQKISPEMFEKSWRLHTGSTFRVRLPSFFFVRILKTVWGYSANSTVCSTYGITEMGPDHIHVEVSVNEHTSLSFT